MKLIKNKKGFTLIELLVVIVIIAVLFGIIALVLNPGVLTAKSRDSKRLAELDAVNKAINLALAEGEITLLPGPAIYENDSSSGAANVQSMDGSGYIAFEIPTGKQGLSKYLSNLPVDPTNDGITYVYYFASNGTDYELNTVFEHPDNQSRMATDGGDNDGKYEIGSNLELLN